jgi:hypothetical protein
MLKEWVKQDFVSRFSYKFNLLQIKEQEDSCLV